MNEAKARRHRPVRQCLVSGCSQELQAAHQPLAAFFDGDDVRFQRGSDSHARELGAGHTGAFEDTLIRVTQPLYLLLDHVVDAGRRGAVHRRQGRPVRTSPRRDRARRVRARPRH